MLLKKLKPRFSWRRVNPADVFLPHAAQFAYVLCYGEKSPGAVFSWDKRRWWFRSEDGRDSFMNSEPGLTFTQARKAMTAHARYILGLKIIRR
jgi:hypothetical protein